MNETRPAATAGDGLVVDCRKMAEAPTAAVLVRAESNEQLTHILLALSKAVEDEQQRCWEDLKSHSKTR